MKSLLRDRLRWLVPVLTVVIAFTTALAQTRSHHNAAEVDATTTVRSGTHPVFDIMSDAYKAKCDGTTDDTAAIQAAIDAAGAAGGGTVLIPEGTCVTGTLLLGSGDENVEIVGVGNSSILYLKTGTNDTLLNVISGNDCAIRHLSMQGNSANNSATSRGIFVDEDGFQIEGLIVTDFNDEGIYIDNDTARSSVTDTRSYSNGGHGLKIRSSSRLFINNLRVEDNLGAGIDIDTLSSSTFSNVVAEDNALDGIHMDGSLTDLTFSGVVSISNNGDGFELDTDAEAERIIFSACSAEFNDFHGFLIGTASALGDMQGISLSGCMATNNSQGTTTTYDGVNIYETAGVVRDISIEGGSFSDYQATQTQRYGINVGAGPVDIFYTPGITTDNVTAATNGTLNMGAAGSDNEIQVNKDGVLTGDPNFTWDDSIGANGLFTINGSVAATSTFLLTSLTDCEDNDEKIAGNNFGILYCDDIPLPGVESICADTTSAATITVDDCEATTLIGSFAVRTMDTCNAALEGRHMFIRCGAAGGMGFTDNSGNPANGNIRLFPGSASTFSCSTSPPGTISFQCRDDGSGNYFWYEFSRNNPFTTTLRASASEILYNDSGIIGGESGFEYDDVANVAKVPSLEIDDSVLCDSDTEKLETDGDGTVSCGTIPTIPALPVSTAEGGTGQDFSSSTGAITVSSGTMSAGTLAKGFGGTGVASWSADSIFGTDGLGALEWKVTSDFVTLGGIQTLTNKTLTSPVINGTVTTTGLTMPAQTISGDVALATGVVDSTLATSGTAFQLDATAGGHSGDLLQIYDGGTTKFTFTDAYNLEFDDNSAREGGFYQGFSEASFPSGGSTQPKNAVSIGYSGNPGTGKSFRGIYLQANPRHNSSATGNSFYGGVFEVKETNGDSGRIAATMAGGLFQYLGAASSQDSTTSRAAGGQFNTVLSQAGTQTITDLNAGHFYLNIGGTNKVITTAAGIEVQSPGSSLGAGGSVGLWTGIRVEDQRNDRVTATAHDAITVESQTADGSVGTDGNVRMVGGDWDDGHIQLGSSHIWSDGTNLRGKNSVPTSTGDGFVIGASTDKFWTFTSPSGSSGTFYWGGFYDFASSDNDFNPSVNFGTSNAPYGAHFFVVCAAGASGGTDTVVRITGTSVTDGATRTTSDTQDITMDDAGAAGAYYETSKKWLGQVSAVVNSGPDLLCNYGWAKYWDYSNTDFTVSGLEATWLGGANDTGADISLLHHTATGWTYNAGSEPTPPTAIASMATDYVTENDVKNNEQGAWKRTNLSTAVTGSGSEGVIVEVVTTANKAFELGTFQLTISAN